MTRTRSAGWKFTEPSARGRRADSESLSPAELERLIAEFENAKRLAREKSYCDELFDCLLKIRTGYATTTINLSMNCFLRARKLREGIYPQNVSEVWHPPPHQVRHFGRANVPYAPILYGADGELTALNEVGAGIGDHAAILRMKLKSTHVRLHIFMIGEIIHRYRTGRSLLGLEKNNEPPWASFGVNKEKVRLIDGFYSKVFKTRGNEIYPLTAAIAQDFLSPEDIDGIAYPTVAGPAGINLALKPESARRLLEIEAIYVLHLQSKVGVGYKAKCIKTSSGVSSDGSIIWGDIGDVLAHVRKTKNDYMRTRTPIRFPDISMLNRP